MQHHPAQGPGFQISMRYAPHLTAFEVWVVHIDGGGGWSVLSLDRSNVLEEDIRGSMWASYTSAQSAPPSFLIAPEETYDLARELHRYGPFKPDKPEPDTEQIGWLRGMLEKVIDFKLNP